jgi:hypothetical protein
MEKAGTLTGFLFCKIGMALAAIAFIGFALSLNSAITRFASREDLELVAETITSAIEKMDGCPAEAELYRELPQLNQTFEVIITGEKSGGVQEISVRVISGAVVDRSLTTGSTVNNGYFRLSMKDPRGIIVRKMETMRVELVG